MDATEVLRLLGATTLAGSAAAALVVVLARPLRRRAGAACAYRAWWMVPLSMLAVLLPARVVVVEAGAAAAVAPTLGVPVVPGMDAGVVVPTPASWLGTALLLAWIAGACVVVWQGLRAHRRYLDALGALHRRDDGLFESAARQGLPAVVGLRARIVLPADFDVRFSAAEQALVLAHERVHVARRDVWWNACAAVLYAVHWFNPVAWWALRRFRLDQELACDAEVLARAPGRRRSYAEALLKVQVTASAVPLACQWPGTHPLKERITMLAQDLPAPMRRRAGTAFVFVAATAFAMAAWAVQPPRLQAAAAPANVQENGDWTTHGPVDPAAIPGRAAAERSAAAADLRLLNPEALDAAAVRDWLASDVPARMVIEMVAVSLGLEVEPEAAGLRFVPVEPDRVDYAPGTRTVRVSFRNRPVGELLRELADATGRRLVVADGVDLSQPVSVRMRDVPLSSIEALVGQALGEARLEADDASIRVVPAPGGART